MSVEIYRWFLKIPILISVLFFFVFPYFLNKGIKLSTPNRFIRFMILVFSCLLVFAFVTWLMTYWMEELSKDLLLVKMGVNTDSFIHEEMFEQVPPKYLAQAKEIHESQMGIGWPLKAMFTYIFLVLPSSVVYCLMLVFVDKIHLNKS
ncbi:hypothetical protein EQP59_05665 [Ornithobacterium rhinotracheale]|uniref:DUF4199 domain-containing protein n=1 Tax=Ornithobacterium rhinotracheale TaxID=28251 RepID=A0A3R5Y3J6_ORNRH|nr:hypothetical protein [Ornithobacterium rhinotracheale]QAR30855.1 hypothetical protein EQP59_05665 [Ornithobacterium rhinotracheale]